MADHKQAMQQIYDLVNDDQLDRAEELIDRDVIEHEDLPIPPGTTGVTPSRRPSAPCAGGSLTSV